MNVLARLAPTISAAALFAGCAGSQPPIGAPGTSAPALPGGGVIRQFPTTSSFQVLHKFGRHANSFKDHGGAFPASGLTDVNGTLYGTTGFGGYDGNGIVYSISTTGVKRTLYRFRGQAYGDGTYPTDDLTDVKGSLYGTTFEGGKCGVGTVYSVSTTGSEKVVYTFCDTSYGGPTGGVVNVKGTLYGTTVSASTGDVYSLSPSGQYKLLYVFGNPYGDGVTPYGRLLNVNGTLYGTTTSGGSGCQGVGGCGTVYSVTTSGKEKVLYSFQGGSDGNYPFTGLIELNGTLYGTTVNGGGSGCHGGCGTAYSVTTKGVEKVLYRFKGGADGGTPAASLHALNGTLYGTTSVGGANGFGTAFSLTTSGREHVLHSFSGSDGAMPTAHLIDVGGTLYGTTHSGGFANGCQGKGCGTVFALSP